MAEQGSFGWHLAFLIVACCGIGYFLFRTRRFDFFSLAFFGGCFYFLPGLLGFAGYAEGVLLTPVPIVPGAYAVMCTVLLAVLLLAILLDRESPSIEYVSNRDSGALRFFAAVATLLGVAGFLLSYATIGNRLFDPDKFALLAELNRWYLLWTSGATLGAVASYTRGLRALCVVNIALLLANLYVGFRVDLVIVVLAIGTLALNRRGPLRLAGHWRMGLLVALFGIVLFAYKYVLFALKSLDTELLMSQVQNPDAFRLMFLYSEPFVAQGTLNEVVRQEYLVGPGHLASILMLFFPFASELGVSTIGFNDLFQRDLFSSVTEYGLGSNIWAEMLATGGWPALLILLAILGLLLHAANRWMPRVGAESAALIVIVAVYWAFYVHRNDLLYQLTLTRRMILVWMACALVSLAVSAFFVRARVALSGYTKMDVGNTGA